MEYLYHYTNLDALEKILENKTLRLTSLNYMDDLEEGETSDFDKLGRYIYISSWTSNSDESLVLWNYSRGKDGIRIRMKRDPFKVEKIKGMYHIHGHNVEIDQLFNVPLLKMMMNETISFGEPIAKLIRVTYTDQERLLRPKVYRQFLGNNFSIETENLGVFKRVEWETQREWRYRLTALPLKISEFDIFSEPFGEKKLIKKIKTRKEINFIDLELSDDAFEGIEILCSSKITETGKERLQKIISKYIPNAKVENSKLRLR